MLLCSRDTHHLFPSLFRIPYRLCRAAEIPVQGGDHNIAVIHHPSIPLQVGSIQRTGAGTQVIKYDLLTAVLRFARL